MVELKAKSLQKSVAKDWILLLAPAKEGKTTAALTLSPKCDPTFSKPQTIDDLMVVTFENDALKGPKLMGVELEHWYDLTEFSNQGLKAIDDAIGEVVKLARSLAKEGKIKGVVWDTPTSLDETWKAYLAKSFEKWGLIDQLLIKHRAFLMDKCSGIDCPQVFLMHVKKMSESMDDAKKEQSGIDKSTKLVMGLSGWDAPALYRKQCSYILPLERRTQGGKDSVWICPGGTKTGIEFGGRYGLQGPPADMPANLKDFLAKANNTK